MYTVFTMVAAIKHPGSETVDNDLFARLWREDLTRSHGFERLRVEGTLPASLRGTLFRNGPGQFGIGEQRYQHPFEGDGAITAVRFDGQGALGASRITSNPQLEEERRAGKPLYGLSSGWLRRMSNMVRGRQKNTANTSVMIWQDRLFAMVESSLPTEISQSDLSVIGETALGGVVRASFSAHPHRVAARKATYNFGVVQGRKTELVVYELPDVGHAREVASVQLGGSTMLHDFIVTQRHAVFFVSPVRIDVPKMLLGLGSFDELFVWKPELGVDVIVIPLDAPANVTRFTTDAFFQWHFVNAWDDEDGRTIVIDYQRYPDFSSFDGIGRLMHGGTANGLLLGRYHRARLDVAAKTLRSEQLLDRACEFGTIARGSEGTPHDVAYVALDNLAAVGRFDLRTNKLDTHELPSSQRTTEPIAVGDHVLALQHDATRDLAFLAVYDAARIPDGPVARAWFDHQVPITFHGTWSPQS